MILLFTSLGFVRGNIASINNSTAIVEDEFTDQEIWLIVDKVVLSDKSSYFVGSLIGDSRFLLTNLEDKVDEEELASVQIDQGKELNKLRFYFDKYKFLFTSGDKVLLIADIYPFYPKVTKYGYDFKSQQLFAGIGGLARVLRVIKIEANNNISLKLTNFFDELRENISIRYKGLLSPDTESIATIIITAKREIRSALYSYWQIAGTSHLLAISGLHIGFVAMFVYLLIRKTALIVFRERYFQSIKYLAIFLSLLAISGYLILSGISTSALRAYIMVVTLFVALLLSRPLISLYNVALAALIIALINPYLITSPSFQFSFLAVIAIVSGFTKDNSIREEKSNIFNNFLIKKLQKYLSVGIKTTLLAGLAVMPLTIYYLGYISVYGIIANLILVPLVTIFIIPLLFFSLLLQNIVGDKLILLAGSFIDLANIINQFISSFPYAKVMFISYAYIDILIFVTGGLIYCLHRSRLRYIGLMLIFVFFIKILIFNIPPQIVIFGGGKSIVVRSDSGYYINRQINRGSNFERDAIYQSLAIDKSDIELFEYFDSDDDYSLDCVENFCLYKIDDIEIGIIDKLRSRANSKLKEATEKPYNLASKIDKCDNLSLVIIIHDASFSSKIDNCLKKKFDEALPVVDMRALDYKARLTTFVRVKGKKIVIYDSR